MSDYTAMDYLREQNYPQWRAFRDFWWEPEHIRMSMFEAFDLFKTKLIARAEAKDNEGKESEKKK